MAEVDENESAQEKNSIEIQDDIVALFGQTGEDRWDIRVYRIVGNHKQGGGELYLFCVTPDELPIEDRIRDERGGGAYRIRVFKNRRPFTNFRVDIEEQEKPPEQIKTGGGDASSIVAAINEANTRFMESMRTMLQPIAPAAGGTVSQFKEMVELFKLMQPAAAAVPTIESSLAILQQGIELGKSVAGGGSDTSALGVFAEIMKNPAIGTAIGNLAMKAAPGPGATPGAHVAQQGGNGAATIQRTMQAAPPTMPSNVPMDQNAVTALINSHIAYLVSRAVNGSDPALYAEYVLDNLPGPTIEVLLASPNVIGELAQINGAVGNHVVWFQNLLNEIRAMVEAGTDDSANGPSDDTGRPGGNAGDASPNVGLRS